MREKGSKNTLGQVKHFFTRTSTRLSLSSNAVPGCCFACFWRSFRTKSFYIDFLGVHTGMGLRARLSQPLQEGKGNSVGVPQLSGTTEQSCSPHLPLTTLSLQLPNRFRIAKTGSYSWIKAAALEQNYSSVFGNYGVPQGSLRGALSFSGCHET